MNILERYEGDGNAQIGRFSGNVAMVSHGNDRGLNVRFFSEPIYQPKLSEIEGRAIYKDVEKCHVVIPGGKTDNIFIVTHEDGPDGPCLPNRFPAQYKAFKSQKEQVPTGTSLEMCKFIPAHRVMELKSQNVHTAEQFAGLPDSIVQGLGMGAFKERDLCRTYLGNDDEKTKMVSKAMAETESLKGELEAMRQQMADLNRIMAEKMAGTGQIYQHTLAQNFPDEPQGDFPSPKRGPGRPRKEETAA